MQDASESFRKLQRVKGNSGNNQYARQALERETVCLVSTGRSLCNPKIQCDQTPTCVIDIESKVEFFGHSFKCYSVFLENQTVHLRIRTLPHANCEARWECYGLGVFCCFRARQTCHYNTNYKVHIIPKRA